MLFAVVMDDAGDNKEQKQGIAALRGICVCARSQRLRYERQTHVEEVVRA